MRPTSLPGLRTSSGSGAQKFFPDRTLRRPPLLQPGCPYIHAANCDDAAAKATKLGAKSIMVPPTDIPNIGRFSVIIDPTGAAIAIIKGASR